MLKSDIIYLMGDFSAKTGAKKKQKLLAVWMRSKEWSKLWQEQVTAWWSSLKNVGWRSTRLDLFNQNTHLSTVLQPFGLHIIAIHNEEHSYFWWKSTWGRLRLGSSTTGSQSPFQIQILEHQKGKQNSGNVLTECHLYMQSKVKTNKKQQQPDLTYFIENQPDEQREEME